MLKKLLLEEMTKLVRVKQDNVPHCPVCNYTLDAHSATDDSADLPRSGDVSICFGCTSILIFEVKEGNIDVRIPTEEEHKKFNLVEDIIKIRGLMKQVKSEQHGLN